MIGLKSLLPGASGKIKWQVFNTSGIFTPSADLLANGGTVRAILVPGGAGGAAGFPASTYAGGHAGVPIDTLVTVSGPTAYTIGAGGSGGTGSAAPTPGGNTTFAGIVARGGEINAMNNTGGTGAGSLHNGVDCGIGVILPVIGPCCAGGSRSNSPQPTIARLWGSACYDTAAVPGKGGGGNGAGAVHVAGGSGCLVLIWEE